MLILQTGSQPAAIRNGLIDMLDSSMAAVRVVSAYATMGGCQILFDCLKRHLTERKLRAIPKDLITSLDYGLTEPELLAHWRQMPNATVRVSGAALLAQETLVPKRAFHPKLYAAVLPDGRANLLVGSANMTARGFSTNTEAVFAQSVSAEETDGIFRELAAETDALTDDILKAYIQLRKKYSIPSELKAEAEPVPPPAPVVKKDLTTFRDAVEEGTLNPAGFEQMWVQSSGMQGGSESQLELPREARRFFGLAFTGYDFSHKETIGTITLQSGSSDWDCLITWHGDNKMERINLPTKAKGGPSYANSAVMFRKLASGAFELAVADWGSDLAHAWRIASANAGRLYRLGKVSDRVVGLI